MVLLWASHWQWRTWTRLDVWFWHMRKKPATATDLKQRSVCMVPRYSLLLAIDSEEHAEESLPLSPHALILSLACSSSKSCENVDGIRVLWKRSTVQIGGGRSWRWSKHSHGHCSAVGSAGDCSAGGSAGECPAGARLGSARPRARLGGKLQNVTMTITLAVSVIVAFALAVQVAIIWFSV